MRVCVIPARGGSKRIPRKNIRQFFGRPMIGWSISAALDTGIFDRVIVSTEDAEIAEIARREGAEVPFARPPHLADDFAPTIAVVSDALSELERAGSKIDIMCCLYATAPFVSRDDLTKARDLLEAGSASYVMPVTTFAFPIQRAVRVSESQRLELIEPKHAQTRSQDLEECFHDAGQFYFGRSEAWRAETPIIGPETEPLIIPRHRVQDIDTTEDWYRAELMFASMQNSDSVP